MLPFRTGTLVLSEASKEKLDRFYRRFISGSGSHLDAVNHIIYACHAAMPLLVSPELANLTWLNFNTYTIKGKMQKIDRVVVSDFLLSPLVRPVGGRQYELIPEIRTYLLYLLNDNKWFQFLGIESFGPERATTLAKFLRQYLADKRSASESNAAGFREINDWAAMAYLHPNELAIEIAKAYESTFADPEKINEKGQLRLNMIMERIGQQVNQNIHVGDKEERRVFMNMQSYSKANKSILFNEEIMTVSNTLYDEVDDEFLDIAKPNEAVIQLPLKKGIGQRLNRKKNKIQRVIPVIVGLNTSHAGMTVAGVESAKVLDDMFRTLGNSSFNIPSRKILLNGEATRQNIEDAIGEAFDSANDEDIVVISFCGRGNAESSNIQLADVIPEQAAGVSVTYQTFLTRDDFKNITRKKRGNKRCQMVFILDAESAIGAGWIEGRDIQISSPRNHFINTEVVPSLFIDLFTEVIELLDGKISYNNLAASIRENLTIEYGETAPVVLLADQKDVNKYIFSREAPDSHDLLIEYITNGWTVLLPDFSTPVLNSEALASDYPAKGNTKASGNINIINQEIVFSGRTESLSKGKFYSVGKPPLMCLYVPAQPVDPELTSNIQGISFDPFCKWGHYLVYIDSNENNEEIFRNAPKIYAPEKDNAPYHIIYPAQKGFPELGWYITGGEAVVAFMEKLCRYISLTDLENPLANPSNQLQVNWQLGWAGDRTEGQILELNQYTTTIEDGEVLITPLSLTITQREEFLLFCKVYLMLPDLSILDITTPDIAMLSPMKTAELIIDNQQLLQQIFTPGNPSNIKVLTSKTPIIVDFSQTGISKNSAHGNRKPQ